MITRTYYKNKKGQVWFLEINGTTVTSGTEGNTETKTYADNNETTNAFNALLMKKIGEGYEFDKVETIETQEDVDARTVGGVELATNQFVTNFGDKNALKATLRNHIDKYHQYIDAVSGKGVQYGEVKDGKFVPHASKSGDNELDFWTAAASHPEFRPLIKEFVEMVANANFGEEPRLRDKETPIGAMAAFANAMVDKEQLVSYRRLVDSLMPISCYAGRFATKGADGGRHVPQLVKKWGYKADDEYAIEFLVAQLVAIDNKNQKEETEILLNEFGLADALKDKKFMQLVYRKFMNRTAYIMSQNDVSESAMGKYLFDALNALGIKCSKDDAYMVAYLIEDIGHYPSIEQLLKGKINEDDDFTPLDDKNYDDDDDDDDDE